ncbi:hypothetical protein GQ600_3810 [Phytophthora cactorum]|nr:hypothetical protein GQ600_3810 [Phytophthora cactorum]
MVLRAVKLIVQASLLLQVLQCSASVNGVEVNENFQNTPLSTKDKLKLGTVTMRRHPGSGFAGLGFDPGYRDGEFATTTPIPGTARGRLQSRWKHAGAGSSATTPKTKKRKTCRRGDVGASSGSTSGSDATETTRRERGPRNVWLPLRLRLEAKRALRAVRRRPRRRSPPLRRPRSPSQLLFRRLNRRAESGSDDLSDLLSGSTASGSEDLSDLLGSSAGSGSEADMSALLGSESNDALTALLGSGVGGSGSMLSFEDFMKEYGSMFGSGSSAIDLFGDSSTPQNNTVNDDDILLGELAYYGRHDRLRRSALGQEQGQDCIFYLKMTTSGGKTIATGTKTANSAVMKPPKGYQLAGFYGHVMAITSKGSPDIYNYETTIRNWVGLLKRKRQPCYQKRVDVSSQGMWPPTSLLPVPSTFVNAVKSLIYYLRYKQTTIPTTDTEKLMDKAFQMQIVILDLPIAICSCLGIKIPPKLQFSATILAVVSAIVMMAVMIGEALFASSNNVMLMLRESGALNNTALDGDTIQLDTFLNTKNGTCGYEMKH